MTLDRQRAFDAASPEGLESHKSGLGNAAGNDRRSFRSVVAWYHCALTFSKKLYKASGKILMMPKCKFNFMASLPLTDSGT
jgi:hypothetical protein